MAAPTITLDAGPFTQATEYMKNFNKQLQQLYMDEAAKSTKATMVPPGEFWIRLVPGITKYDILEKAKLVKMLREESDCEIAEAHHGVEAFVQGKFLRFKVVGQAYPTTFVHDTFQTYLSGVPVPEGSYAHSYIYATNMFAAQKVAADADADGAPVYYGPLIWKDEATGLYGQFAPKAVDSNQFYPQVAYDKTFFWYALPDSKRQMLKDHRAGAVADIRKSFNLELKPALRVFAALVGGRLIRMDAPAPKILLWGTLERRTNHVHWNNLHKPLLKVAKYLTVPGSEEPKAAKTPRQLARAALDNLEMPPITPQSRAQITTLHQLKEVAELAYETGLNLTARVIAEALTTIPIEQTKAELGADDD